MFEPNDDTVTIETAEQWGKLPVQHARHEEVSRERDRVGV
jgi:hypothetical protein